VANRKVRALPTDSVFGELLIDLEEYKEALAVVLGLPVEMERK